MMNNPKHQTKSPVKSPTKFSGEISAHSPQEQRHSGIIGFLFTDHPASLDETYFEHLRFALSVGTNLILAGIAAMVHALVPCLCQTTASRAIIKLAHQTSPRTDA
jgi:hypothetical protein